VVLLGLISRFERLVVEGDEIRRVDGSVARGGSEGRVEIQRTECGETFTR
jgi:hypothetical protein